MTESRTLTQTARIDADALFREHHEKFVRQLLSRYEVPRELAEDACSVAWARLLRRDPVPETVAGWVYTVAKHELFELIRRRQRDLPVDELWVRGQAEDLEAHVDAQRGVEFLGTLKPQQRVVLHLRAKGYSYDEICEITGQTYTWVNRHINEGRAALRKFMTGR